MTKDNGLLVIIAILAVATAIAIFKMVSAPNPLRGHAPAFSDVRGGLGSAANRGVRARIVVMVLVGLLVGIGLIWLGTAVPAFEAVPAVASVGLGLSAALVTSAALPRRSPPQSPVAAASLQPRYWWTFAQPRSVRGLGALAAAVLVVLLAYVSLVAAVPAMAPPSASFWMYPAAITGMLILLLLSSYLALSKAAVRPLVSDRKLLDMNLALRSASARIIATTTGAVLFGYLAAITVTVGGLLSTLGELTTIDGSPNPALSFAGAAVQLFGAGFVACSISSTAAAAAQAVSLVTLPRRCARRVLDRAT